MKKHLSPTLGLIFAFCFFLFIPQMAKAATPPAPSLLSPASGASVSAPLTISWSAVTDPSGIIAYNWQVSTSSTFSAITANNSTMGPTQDTVSGLGNGTYFWRVQSVNSNFVQSAWSAARSFTITGVSTGALAAPTLGPTKGYSTFHPLEVMTFNWNVVQGAASYVIQASTDPNFPVSSSFSMNNIPDPTYSFSTPNEGNYFARVFAVDANGVRSAPSNVITFSIFYSNPLPAPPNIISPTNAGTLTLPVTLTWSDVPNPQPSGYEVEIAKDSGFQTIEESDPQLNNPSRTVLSLTPGTKYWRVRSHQGDASPTTAAVTKWSASGSFTVSQAPAAPVSLAFTSNPLYSGNSTLVQIQLSTAAPSSGAVISLTSSDPNAAPVPATVTMPANTAWMQFQMKAGQVTTETPVTITASLNSGSASAQLTVLPPSIKSLSISPTTFNGGISVQAIAMLNGVAPANGASITFSSSSPAVQAPAAETVAAGSPSVVFQIPTTSVTANTPATVTATYNGQSVESQITLTPQGQPSALSLSPSSV
ncbi:MAG TPA: fibronectin type III domain-containing protein, partial [Candidatus Acidoferrales bacterium]|nr:fibronectin type III domain-containing protein [Candidatus Acidoferrales bacterium]